MPSARLDSKPVVLITGCSTGIGYAAALRLAKRGFWVFATLRDLTKAGPLQKEAKGLGLEILALDVDKPASVRRAVWKVKAKAGRIDVLINNAGYGAFGAFEDFSDQETRAQYQTNVFGLMRLTREVLPLMREAGKGKIIHIGSLAGKMTFSGIGLYCSSKYAVEALTEALRLETQAFGVQTAVVEPGSRNTAFKANRRANGVFSRGRSAYQGSLQKILDFGNTQSAAAAGAEAVVDAIEKAIEAPVMKARYPVGTDAKLYPLVRWFLPESAWDFLMRRVAGKFQSGKKLQAPKPWAGAKVALVTGATSGFGLETAKLLSARGYRVYGTYRNPHRLDDLRAVKPSVFPLFMDLDRPLTVAQGMKRLFQKEKRLDLLVNNAGFVMAGFLEDLSDGEFESQFQTNVFGLLRVTQAALPIMRKQGSGHILNLGSISGRVAFPGLGAYAASKFAVRSISEGLRQEVRPFGIKVSEIAPGSYGTKVLQSTRYGVRVKAPNSPYTLFTLQMEKLVQKEFAKGRDPREVAGLILKAAQSASPQSVYLAGPDAKFLNFAKWLLPDAWFQWAIERVFPWSRPPAKTKD